MQRHLPATRTRIDFHRYGSARQRRPSLHLFCEYLCALRRHGGGCAWLVPEPGQCEGWLPNGQLPSFDLCCVERSEGVRLRRTPHTGEERSYTWSPELVLEIRTQLLWIRMKV